MLRKEHGVRRVRGSRVEVGAKMSTVILEAVPDIQRQAIDQCGEGDPNACAAVPLAIPFTAAVGVLFAPFGFLIGASMDDVPRTACS